VSLRFSNGLGGSDLQKSVVEEQADRLRLLVEVVGHGAFVAAFRNRAEIVLRSRQSSISEFRGAGARAAPAFARPMSPCSVPP
jgi:hypothetical protein